MAQRPEPAEGATASPEKRSRLLKGISMLLVAILGIVLYHNIYQVEFVFDSVAFIQSFKPVHHLWPPDYLIVNTRPVPFLTFAINHAISGSNTWSYQLVNIAIHIANAILIMMVVENTIRYGLHRDEELRSDGWWIALLAGLLWLAHPLQTQSVTYTYQRQESLAVLFYLLAIHFFILLCHRDSLARRIAVLVAIALGLLSKELVATAPLLILWLDRAYFSKSWGEVLSKRWGLHLAAWSLLSVTVLQMWLHRENYANSGVGKTAYGTWWQYALTQPGVITRYLELLMWPDRQVLDAGWIWRKTWDEASGEVIPFLVMLMITIFLVFKWPRIGFLTGAWLIVLSPTSSVVPIADAYFEHRMYLPIAFLAILFVITLRSMSRCATGLWKWRGDRKIVPLVACAALVLPILVALSAATIHRNSQYATAESIMKDNLAKCPDLYRPRYTLALWQLSKGRRDECAKNAAILVNKFPHEAGSYSLFGMVLLDMGENRDAALMFQKSLEIAPDDSHVLLNLGDALIAIDPKQAIPSLERSAELNPNHVDTWYNLGRAHWLGFRDAAKAEQYLLRGIELPGPRNASRELLADIYALTGRIREASLLYDQVLDEEPSRPGVMAKRQSLGEGLR
ncbi:MAG: hypothetical protein C0478_04975 [Planctomyces sp.]|nr:hypothetical protein [Planctomyces sp.]